MHPREQSDLVLEIVPLQTKHKGKEANGVEHKGKESMVPGKGDEVGVYKDDVLEVVDQRLSVQKVVGDCKEIPEQRA